MDIIINLLGFGEMVTVPEMLLRVVIACACGAMIGIERNRRQKDAGIRTHLIVALGAALFMLVSKYGFFDVVVRDSVQVDASRIASCVVTGVSFLGAGVIFVKGTSIRGLTTSAGIWATAAVGLAVGAGMYLIGVLSTLILLLFQVLLHHYFQRLESNLSAEIVIVMSDTSDGLQLINDAMEKRGILAQDFKISRKDDGAVVYRVSVKCNRDIVVSDLQQLMQQYTDVKSVEMKTL